MVRPGATEDEGLTLLWLSGTLIFGSFVGRLNVLDEWPTRPFCMAGT